MSSMLEVPPETVGELRSALHSLIQRPAEGIAEVVDLADHEEHLEWYLKYFVRLGAARCCWVVSGRPTRRGADRSGGHGGCQSLKGGADFRSWWTGAANHVQPRLLQLVFCERLRAQSLDSRFQGAGAGCTFVPRWSRQAEQLI
jgi:hypothetical protein